MTNIAHPEISVCIPVYNCEQYIGAAIESVLKQTFQSFELIILDNCSTDRTLEVIRRYDDPRIRVIENESNIGAGGNWNKALKEANGRFIKILCADDLIYPTCLDRQLSQLNEPANSGVVMVCCGRDIIIDNGPKVMARKFEGVQGRLAGLEAIKKNVRSGTNLIGEPTAVLFRADVLPQMAGFVEGMRYVIDLDFWCRMLLHGDIYVIPESLCVFRVSSDSWSCQVANSQSRDYCALLEKMRKEPRFQLNGRDELLGRLKATINRYLRRLFYSLMARRRTDS